MSESSFVRLCLVLVQQHGDLREVSPAIAQHKGVV